MPHLISESGRAITAHHSLLLINVIDVESQIEPVAPPLEKDTHPLLVEMAENLDGLSADRVEEVFHDAVFAKERAQEYFASGVFSLREKANADLLYLVTLNALQQVLGEDRLQFPEIAAHIDAELVDRYFCNFSVFQSLPDNWAIDQLFPIMPIHRLLEPPTRRGTLQDVTCDSDGVIDRFAGGRKGKPSLELHPVREGEPYILGIFLTGAYQEILGDLHNLFGDTNAVHVRLTEQGYEITDLVHGDTVTEVLNYVQFHASDLLATFRRKVNGAKDLSRQEANSFIADYVAGLEGYTYLEGDVPVGEVGVTPAVRPRLYALLLLIHLLQPAHHLRIRQRRRVAQRPALGDVLEQPAHDLPAPGLGQVGREEDVVGPGDRADLLRHVLLEIVLEAVARLVAALLEGDERRERLTLELVGPAHHRRLGHRRMVHQRALDLHRADPVARHVEHVVHPAQNPPVAVLVQLGAVAGEVAAREAAQ